MVIIWTPQASLDLFEVRTFIGKDNPVAARAVLRRIQQAAGLLRRHPSAGRPGRVFGSRELVVTGTPFILPYRVHGEDVEILRVYHALRRWPKQV